MQTLQKEANGEIKTSVDRINAIAREIATLTEQINTLENYGPRANDLRDQRNNLLDELSGFVEIEVVEQPPADGVGFSQYMIYINDSLLLSRDYVRELRYEPRSFKKNINDTEGLYDLRWSDGDKFNTANIEYTGSLQALFTMRDGNNMEALKGDLTSITTSPEGKQILEMTNTNINDPNVLNMPPTDGIVTIGGSEYVYESFEVTVGADGKYTYTFTMKRQMTAQQISHIDSLIAKGTAVTAGTNVDFKGIPFVMNQLNEFVRTFSENFNDQHKAGYDFEGLAGLEFFNAKVPMSGTNYEFNDQNGFVSVPTVANAGGMMVGSYYHMTCLNFYVSEEIDKDPRKIAMSDSADAGHGNHENVNKLSNIKDMHDMFIHGAPATFLQALVSVVAGEGSKAQTFAQTQKYVSLSVENRRLEISGADKDEEGEDLIRFQSLLKNQFKVLSVMNEILNKLINDTGVG